MERVEKQASDAAKYGRHSQYLPVICSHTVFFFFFFQKPTLTHLESNTNGEAEADYRHQSLALIKGSND